MQVVISLTKPLAGDILSSSKTSTEVVLPDFRAFSFSTVLKEYSVLVKGLMGKYERILSIDNDYFHLVSSSKHFFDRELGKTVTFCLFNLRHRSHYHQLYPSNNPAENAL